MMGRRFCPGKRVDPSRCLQQVNWLASASAIPLLCVMLFAAIPPVAAQTAAASSKSTASEGPAKMLVEAAELRYDVDKNTVSAEGNARVYYKDETLQADRIVYNRNTGRVYAEGHAKFTAKDGTVTHADRFELTDDFRDGFIESLHTDTPPKPYVNVLPGPLVGFQPPLAGGNVTGTYKS